MMFADSYKMKQNLVKKNKKMLSSEKMDISGEEWDLDIRSNYTRSQTANIMVFGETGRYPLFALTAVKAVKYCLRVVAMSQEKYTRKAYTC